jgi:two-component system, chemotaxis family, response regulator Rcp1
MLLEPKPVEILLVEDNPMDVIVTREALKDGKVCNHLSVVQDGEEAIRFLRREEPYANAPRPDVILLDLNLPKKDGREVLSEIKEDPGLRDIPVIVLTTSKAEEDINKSYQLHANCFITKPVDIPIRHKKYNIAESCHCEGVKPEAISRC